jgi:prephenate dehydratase
MKIAIQGIEGSFHHQATQKYFTQDIEIVGKNTFPEVFNALLHDEVDYACVAIENAIYGSLHENYDLLRSSNLKIVGELFLKIDFSFLVLPGERLESIVKILSHPVALKQCQKFLEKLDVELIEHEDTAGAAKDIATHNLTHTAALASSAAGKLFGLESLADAVQDQKNNYTRFLILSKELTTEIKNKLSLNFRLTNEPGSLLSILQIIADHKGNMTKLESRPIIGEVWHYQFYVDIVVDPSIVGSLLSHLEKATESLILLGNYQSGDFVEN